MGQPTPTSIVMLDRLVFPPGTGLQLENDGTDLDIKAEDDGSLVLLPASEDTAAAGFARRRSVNRKLLLQATETDILNWPAGQTVEFFSVRNAVVVRPVDGRHHAGFTNPAIGADGLPIPPNWLMQAFTSNTNTEGALNTGRRTAELVTEFSRTYGPELREGMSVLDFGCGIGRVARFFPQVSGADVIGCDLHEAAIEWCQAHMPHGTYLQGTPAPPLDLADNSVDLLLAVSVLTHLDENLEDKWLADWKRVLKPGGLAVVTYHGVGLIEANIPKESPVRDWIEQEWEKRGGIAFLDNKAWEGVFPDIYQTTYHSEDHLRRVWGAHFEILDLLPSGNFTNTQDVAILRA